MKRGMDMNAEENKFGFSPNVFRHKLENRMNTRRTCSKNLENGKSSMTSNRMLKCEMLYLLRVPTCNTVVLQLITVRMWLKCIEK